MACAAAPSQAWDRWHAWCRVCSVRVCGAGLCAIAILAVLPAGSLANWCFVWCGVNLKWPVTQDTDGFLWLPLEIFNRTLKCHQLCCFRALPASSFLHPQARSRFCLILLVLFQWEGPWTSGRDLTYERKHWKGEKTLFYEQCLKCIFEVLYIFFKWNVVVWTTQQFPWKILTVVKRFTFLGERRL